MPNVISGASFPLPNAAWTLSGSASITDAYGGNTGPTALQLIGRRSVGSGNLVSQATQIVSVDPFATYLVSVYANGDNYSTTPLRITLDDGVSPMVADVASPSAFGWVLLDLGVYVPQSSSVSVRFESLLPTGSGAGLGTSGFWLLDDASMEEEAVSKRRDIREALVARVGTVTTGNGYAMSVGEVVTGGVRSRDNVGAWPHVQVWHGDETKEMGALQRKASSLHFNVRVFCKADGSTNPDDQCDDLCAEIEKAVEAFSGGQWLALGYIQNVFVVGVEPEELPEEIHQDVRLWVMTIRIDYVHERQDP